MAEQENSVLKGLFQTGYQNLFTRSWPMWVGGLLLGTLTFMMFVWARPWGVVAGIRNWADWLFYGLGLYAERPELPSLDTTSVQDIGLLMGALASALLAREFAFRVPPKIEVLKGLVAGGLMGLGAGLARGCNVGGFFSPLSALSLGGLAMMVGLFIGAYLGLRYLYWEMEKFPSAPAAPEAEDEAEEGGFDWKALQPYLGALVFLLALIFFFIYSAWAYTRVGGLLLFGVALGFVLHRCRFCFVRAFRDPFMTSEAEATRALILALLIAVLGFSTAKWMGVREEMNGVYHPFWLGSLIGGVIFGLGMVIAGGCGSGSLWRAAEGQIKLWLVIVTFGLSNSVVRRALLEWDLYPKLGTPLFGPHVLGWPVAVIGLIVLLLVWYVAAAWNEETEKFVVEL